MNKKMLKKLSIMGLGMTLLISTSMVSLAAFTLPREVQGNGVRLRNYPYTGTVLGLMYDGERVWENDEDVSSFTNWANVKREAVNGGASGWCDPNFIKVVK